MMTTNSFKSLLIIALLGVFGLTSCEETLDNSDPVVVSEDVIYLSGEVVRITGRILTLPAKGVDDRGFLLAKEETFASPIVISNGPTDLPGRFISVYENLEISTQYFAKAYVEIDGEQFYGTTVTFSTLGPFITDYYPKGGISGTLVTIEGGNFTQDTKVYVNNNEAVITDMSFESYIEFRVPPITTEYIAEVKVVVQDDELIFNQPFEYIIGVWEVKTNFVNTLQLLRPVASKIDNEVLIGLGRDVFTGNNLQFWKVNLDTYTWAEVTYSGSYATVPFVGSGYFGGGISAPGGGIGAPFVPNYEFWTYDPMTQNLVQEASLPFDLAESVTITTNDGLYVMGGYDQYFIPNRTVYFFDNVTRQWSEFRTRNYDFPTTALYTEDQGLLYILFQGALYRYDVITDQLDFITGYPGSPTNVEATGVAEVIGSRIYIGLFENSQEMWEFDLNNLTWKRKAFFPGFPGELVISSWVHNNTLHLLRSTRTSFTASNKMEIWTFEPDKF